MSRTGMLGFITNPTRRCGGRLHVLDFRARMKGIGRISAAIGAGLAGVGAAVFLHPRSGARNRRVAAGAARRHSATVATMVGASVSKSVQSAKRKLSSETGCCRR